MFLYTPHNNTFFKTDRIFPHLQVSLMVTKYAREKMHSIDARTQKQKEVYFMLPSWLLKSDFHITVTAAKLPAKPCLR